MAKLARENGFAALDFARRTFLALLDDVPPDKYIHQPMPGANHTLWIAGHLAHSDDSFLTHLQPRPTKFPAAWDKLFGQGSKPEPNASAYPPMSEIKDKMASIRDELMNWFKSMKDEQLKSPLPKDWLAFSPTFGALMSTIAWHEGLHSGQLTVIRKSLGFAPKFG